MIILEKTTQKTYHPLEPLTTGEINKAGRLIKDSDAVSDDCLFVSVSLHEPPKKQVLDYPSESIERKAFVILINRVEETTYEVVVSISNETILSVENIPDVQPAIVPDEFEQCEETIKNHPEIIEAVKKRGIDDMENVMVDPWSAGNFGYEEEEGKRIARAMCWLKKDEYDNGYARPISGLYAFVDLNKLEVISVIDKGPVSIPPLDGNYAADRVPNQRTDINPLDIIQEEGPSFHIDGHHIYWQKWNIRFGFTAREGLVLHQVSYTDQGEERPILFRASLSEMVVPYADPEDPVSRNNAFDAGEYGIGMLANSLELGCDCLGEIRYFDGVVSNSKGEAAVIPNAICLHEEDYGILWKHTDWRTDHVEVRRSRRLVLSSISTVGNYEYGFFWCFYQDGNIEFEVKLTGILHTQALEPGETSLYGNLVAPQLYAPHHQHFFNVRLDMMIDGVQNTVSEVNTEQCPADENNPYKNAFVPKTTAFTSEQESIRDVNTASARYWKVSNPNKTNIVGAPVSYKLFPGENCFPYAHEDSSILQRAGFLKHHMHVTPYKEDERYASGDYPNQHPGGAGLTTWMEQDRSIENDDVVVWYTMGHHHITRPEDWPVMPVAYMGFSLKPVGFFDQNPAIDVPPSKPKHQADHCHCD
ncbi:primary-amine oxidase [Salibacterium salarium]|uniref:Amine oxidase n=1 Tax=Salibacterium salarium TaxID=284579 RepID=A0A428MW08_9BACI|nr:primary-amine oxidase [Salibacterium salarium]